MKKKTYENIKRFFFYLKNKGKVETNKGKKVVYQIYVKIKYQISPFGNSIVF